MRLKVLFDYPSSNAHEECLVRVIPCSLIFNFHQSFAENVLQALEAEAASGNPEAMVELRKEISIYRSKIDLLEIETNKKDKEIELLKKKLEESAFIASSSKVEDKLKMLLNENENLRAQIQRYQEQSDTSKVIDKTKKGILEQLNLRLGQNVHELRQIQQELHALLSAS